MLDNLFNNNRDKIISIYQMGSKCINLDTPQSDNDISVWVTKDVYDKYYKYLYIEFKKIKYDAHIHIYGQGIFNNLFNYQFHYMKLLYGEELNLEYDIINNIDNIKQQLILIDSQLKYLKKQRKNKNWYHIWITINIIKNKSYNLTPEILSKAKEIKEYKNIKENHQEIIKLYDEVKSTYIK